MESAHGQCCGFYVAAAAHILGCLHSPRVVVSGASCAGRRTGEGRERICHPHWALSLLLLLPWTAFWGLKVDFKFQEEIKPQEVHPWIIPVLFWVAASSLSLSRTLPPPTHTHIDSCFPPEPSPTDSFEDCVPLATRVLTLHLTPKLS